MGSSYSSDLYRGTGVTSALFGYLPLLHKFLGMGDNSAMDPGKPPNGLPFIVEPKSLEDIAR